MKVDREPDHITSQAFNIDKIPLCEFCKLDLLSAGSLEPVGEIYSAGERHLTFCKLKY